MNERRSAKSLNLFWVAMVIGLFAKVGWSDARTDYLVKMLEGSSNYRLRVQAATTLGKLKEKQALPNLVNALSDENELVIISAAIAIKQIADTSVIQKVEAAAAATSSDAAKSQLQVTLRILKEIENGGAPGSDVKTNARFLVRVDAMGNSSGMQDPILTALMKKIVQERVNEERDILLQRDKLSTDSVTKLLKKKSLRGYILSGSILRVEAESGSLTVKLGLNLFSNPDYNLLMMPTSEAILSVNESRYKKNKTAEIEKAIRLVSDSLIDKIFTTLRQSTVD